MVFKLLTSRWTWTFLILILLISLIVFMFNSKHLVDNFTDLDLSCYAIQNKYYNIDELLYKSRCPNLVILEKLINGRTAFFAEQGDHNGPYYCTDYILNKIYILYLYEPPSDIEIQTISILQQKYQNKLNIEEYAITTILCSIIYYIDNLPKINKQHSW